MFIVKKLAKNINIKKYINPDSIEIEYLFKNAKNSLEYLSVIEAERQIALENLRALTSELQTKRLRYKVRTYNKYFTL